ncbi:hypothetical protein GGS26DRAFT_455959 [Hypomontagnella submonticulosa]|nr:hypothetical protein GGS26DRAFT_455959 [Hypomontagnella submonticulosa]
MPKFLIPARNSRHRTACFALYRALLNQAPQVQLPNDLATAWGPSNPIKHLIRRAFRRNRADTSPRLVYPALKAGYQILALLRSAASSPSSSAASKSESEATPASPSPNADYTSIIDFLRSRLAERNASLAAKAARPPHSRTPPKPSSAPRPDAAPLLVNIAPAPTPDNPHPKPVYVTPSRPRPASELGGSGRRHVPKIDMASDFPFLRIKKPQPAQLNRVLTQKIRKRVARVNYMQELRDYELPDAKLEDQWEGAVAKLLAETQNQAQVPMRKGGKKTEGDGTPEMREAKAIQKDFRYGNTFLATVKEHGVAHTQRALDLQREDQVARADAMRALIEEEAKLAEQEKAQRTIERRKRWEARMLELHGEGWRELFPYR